MDQGKTPQQALIEFLLVTTDGDEVLQKEERQLKMTFLNRLNEGVLPQELLVSIREMIIQKVLVTELSKYYRQIPPRVADYLVAEVMANPKRCFEFHRELFQHPWEAPLEPPATPFMKLYMSSLKPSPYDCK